MSMSGGKSMETYHLPASAGGGTIGVAYLGVLTILEEQRAAMRGVKQEDMGDAFARMQVTLHQLAFVERNGKPVPATEREAAYYALGAKGAACLSAAYSAQHDVSEEDLADFLESAKPPKEAPPAR